MKSKTKIIVCAFCCDNSYAPYAAVSIASIAVNTKKTVKIYIFDYGIRNKNKYMLYQFGNHFNNIELSFIRMDYDSAFPIHTESNIFPKSVLGRLLIPDLCYEDKIIYCDSDVIFMGDIQEIYEHKIDHYVIGAVPEANVSASMALSKVIHSRLGLCNKHIYFNSGVLLINNRYWKSHKIKNKLFNIAKIMQGRLIWIDQDILNIYFECQYCQMDQRFNFTTRAAINFISSQDRTNKIIVRHFESERKPWLTSMYTKTQPLPNFDDFWNYASMTPFYDALKETYNKSVQRDSPPEYLGNIIKPDIAMLTSLRRKFNKKLKS